MPDETLSLKNGAIDAVEEIPPYVNLVKEQKLGTSIGAIDETLKPYPIASIAYQINTDWAKKNQDVVRKFFLAIARGTQGFVTRVCDDEPVNLHRP